MKGSRSREAATQENENGEAATQASETPDTTEADDATG